MFIATKKGKKKERILKLSNPWGKYEWKGTYAIIQADGQTILMSGVNNFASSYILRKQTMESFGSILKIMLNILVKFVPANTIKIILIHLCHLPLRNSNKSINIDIKWVQGCVFESL